MRSARTVMAALFAVLALGACRVDTSLPAGAAFRCAEGAPCPDDHDCIDQLCVPRGSVEADASVCETFGEVCSVVQQCGCPAGQGCYADPATGGSRCEPAGQARSGEACATSTDCAPGLGCNPAPGASSFCTPYCFDHDDCPSQTCSVRLNGTSGLPAQFFPNLCASVCDPVSKQGCPTDLACYATRYEVGETHTICTTPGMVGTRATCGATTECAPGHYCIRFTGEDVATCGKQCNATLGAGCVPGEVCVTIDPPVEVRGTEYGVCVVPT